IRRYIRKVHPQLVLLIFLFIDVLPKQQRFKKTAKAAIQTEIMAAEYDNVKVIRPPPPQPSAVFVQSPAVESSEACLRHCLTTIDNDIRVLMEERKRVVLEFEARGLKKPECPIIYKYIVKEVRVEKSVTKMPLGQKILKKVGLKK
ncbi:unnamed protein product, partial [Owenia fusiformis]